MKSVLSSDPPVAVVSVGMMIGCSGESSPPQAERMSAAPTISASAGISRKRLIPAGDRSNFDSGVTRAYRAVA
jgi:hypothetical protein